MRLLAMVAALWAGAAAADLYRWVDPETGSVKYSNIPPPWYGNEAKERRAPKVERIPERSRPALREEEASVKPSPAARPAAELPGATPLAALEAKRRQMLPQLAAAISDPAEFQRLIEEYALLVAEMNEKDPKGAPARQKEAETVLDKLVKGTSK